LNQNPEQIARDKIDAELLQCGGVLQNKNQVNLNADVGIAVREYQSDIGPAYYVVFIDKKPVSIVETKRDEAIPFLLFIGLKHTRTSQYEKSKANDRYKDGEGKME